MEVFVSRLVQERAKGLGGQVGGERILREEKPKTERTLSFKIFFENCKRTSLHSSSMGAGWSLGGEVCSTGTQLENHCSTFKAACFSSHFFHELRLS